jgi:crotonobetainyl-CoA:carnitine CoA-transferase CaiB-like acyl-CoA transferase
MNILGGLIARAKTGRGQQIDIPMFETMAAVMLGDHLGGEKFVPRIGTWGYRRMLAPERRPYRTKDGYVAALPYYRKQWSAFFGAVGRSALFEDDPRFSDPAKLLQNVNELYRSVAEILLERTSAEWMELFRKLDIAAMELKSITDLIEDPQVKAAGLLVELEHPTEGTIREVRPPATWSDTPPTIRRQAPHVGEQSAEILAELGYPHETITRLLATGVVRQWSNPDTDSGSGS